MCQRASLALMVLTASAAFAEPPASESRPLGRPPAAAKYADEHRPASESSWGRTILALGGVLVLIVGAGAGARALARRAGGAGLLGALGAGGRAPSGVLEVLARYPVGRGATLVLLKLDRRLLLVCQHAGRGGGAMETLTEITDPEEVASILLRTRDAQGDTLARKFEGLLDGESTAYQGDTASRPLTPPPRREQGTSKVRARLASMRGRSGVEVRA
ncbi:MAG: hypothetical protein HBSAPP03_00500 [Phycisphaerae bacterium]|nr:MAG: hypothetical protein HBSAPP03_00500 [Phycisphaerae bacterium]